MTFAAVFDTLLVLWILYRQTRVRRVWIRTYLRLAVILVALGLVELIGYACQHHLKGSVVAILVLSMAVGAAGLGALRAATVRLWHLGGMVLQQGTWLTISLWLVSLAVHFGSAWWISSLHGPGQLTTVGFLLYLGITYGAQNLVLHRRATALLAEAGPIDAAASVPGGWRGVIWSSGSGGGFAGPGGGARARGGGRASSMPGRPHSTRRGSPGPGHACP